MPEIGQLVPCTTGGWMTYPPQRCPNNHPLGPGQVTVGHLGCSCPGGHITWACAVCDQTLYAPPLSAHCRILNGPYHR